MKVLVDKQPAQEADRITIKINDDLEFRIKYEHGELEIMKINFEDTALSILPKVSNVIGLK
jgi:hypothetical protein